MTAPTDPIAEIRQLATGLRKEAGHRDVEDNCDGDDPPTAGNWLRRTADHLDAYAALLAQPRARTWQPIETAPKDGTWVLGVGEGWHMPEPIMWSRYSNCWVFMDGEATRTTHWQPLPDPPACEQEPRT